MIEHQPEGKDHQQGATEREGLHCDVDDLAPIMMSRDHIVQPGSAWACRSRAHRAKKIPCAKVDCIIYCCGFTPAPAKVFNNNCAAALTRMVTPSRTRPISKR